MKAALKVKDNITTYFETLNTFVKDSMFEIASFEIAMFKIASFEIAMFEIASGVKLRVSVVEVKTPITP